MALLRSSRWVALGLLVCTACSDDGAVDAPGTNGTGTLDDSVGPAASTGDGMTATITSGQSVSSSASNTMNSVSSMSTGQGVSSSSDNSTSSTTGDVSSTSAVTASSATSSVSTSTGAGGVGGDGMSTNSAAGGAMGMGAGGTGMQGADTWTNFAQTFFQTYCVMCHNADNSGDATRDFTMLERVVAEADFIACGVATASTRATLECAQGAPRAEQFPNPAGGSPTMEERERLVAWILAGMPE